MNILDLAGTPMLRTKLLIAFAALAVLGIIGSGISLIMMHRVGGAFATYSDVTAPLLRQSAGLVENARRMRLAAARADDASADPESLRQQVESIDATNRSQLEQIDKLARSAALQVNLGDAVQAENNYAATLLQIIEGATQSRAAEAEIQNRAGRLSDLVRESRLAVREVLDRAEGEVNELEELAKVETQTGAATVHGLAGLISNLLTEIYPRLQNARKLLALFDELNDLPKVVLVQNSDVVLSELEAAAQQNVHSLDVVLRRLSGRMRDDQGRIEAAKIRSAVGRFGAALPGLFEGQRALMNVRAGIERARTALDEVDRQYFAILSSVQTSTDRLNGKARDAAANGFIWSNVLVLASSLCALFAALALAIWFSRRITAPMTMLANHAAEIRRSGELKELPPHLVAGQFDEIEKLTSSFNGMVSELTDARARLIDWSESEIKTQYERLNAAINNMPLGLCMFDRDRKLIVCNKNYATIYGIAPEHTRPGTPVETILQRRFETGTYGGESEAVVADLQSKIASGKPWYGVTELADGRVIAVSHRPTANGGYIAIHEDITDRRAAELKIAHMAHFDALTDLPNRVRFRENMVAALARVDRGSEKMAVLCIDLDHFKDVNDTLGHPIGDALLRQVAERLKPCIRGHDSIARLGGDEFAIVQTAATQPESATALANRLIKELSIPFDIQGHQVVVGTSIGIAVAPDDDTDADALLKKADLALYRAKEDGRGTFRFFEPEMDAKMQYRRALELDLRQALPLGQFEVFYQPLVTVDGGQVSGFEALLRWHHPVRGMVPPDSFISLTEEIGLINSIGAWVLKQACNEAAKWPNDIRIAVNLSPVQFKSKTLVLDVIAALGESGLKPSRLELEITETVLLQDTEATIAILNQLRALGVRISMDDFGTGYSSLGYLRKFPFDKIKIDRSFIRDLADKPDSIAIVRAVTRLGSTLGIATTAEGVETQEQLDMLIREGCTEAQGYLFSKPAPAGDVEGMISRIDDAPGRSISKAVA
jgi:diguanylate cyclase (GGDEF)-like protein